MNKEGRKIVSLSEIAILIIATFAFAYILNEAFSDNNIVSAIDSGDLEPAYTCIKSKEGKICQEYKASECNNKCDGDCIPAQRNEVDSCRLGTCFDKVEGTCQAETPRGICEEFGGQWFDDPYGNIPECETACCLLGNQTAFTTSKQCDRKSELLGVTGKFDDSVQNELSCLALANQMEEGACVSPPEIEGGKNKCIFTKKDECIGGLGGTFYSGYLCSNPELNTDCIRQSTTNCVEGKDEVYWFDSCGNRENVYENDMTKSWNNGIILNSANSCNIFSQDNNLANQKTCGNCIYLLGSKCGEKTSDEYLDSAQNVVCRDLSCIDEEGNRRELGESWCAYQSSIGTDVDKKDYPLRATDVVGSRHFRKICIDGQVQTEPCADYRGEICVEANVNITEKISFSSSACKINRWQDCLLYNKDVKTKGKGIEASMKARDANCTANTDCFLKKVNVDEEFQFDVCVPSYPVGFEMKNYAKVAEDICSYGSQKCTVIYIKDIDGWNCIGNCDCESAKFTTEMNDLCMSLGDCGAEVNIAGDITYNYKVKGAPKLVKNKKYNELLLSYATPVPGKFALPGNLTNSFLLGALTPVQVDGNPTIPQNSPYEMAATAIGAISGGLGGGVTMMANYFARGDNIINMFKQGVVYNVGSTYSQTMTGFTDDLAKFNGIWEAQPQFFVKGNSFYMGVKTTFPTGETYSLADVVNGGENIPADLIIPQEFKGMAVDSGYFSLDAGGNIATDNGFLQLDPTKTNEFLQGTVSSSAGKIPVITDAQTGQVIIDPQAAASKLNTFTTAMNAIGVAAAVFSLAMAIFGPGPKLMGSIIQSGIGLILAILPLVGITLGPFGAIISILVMIVFKLMGIGDTKEVIVSFTCQPWQAPVGGDNCEKCGEEEFPCSKYACQSLGQTCEFINEGSDNELCIDTNPNDVTASKITPWDGLLGIGFN
ncbi:MAG: hypothetical protein Q8L29_02925, partial [archaeon]|nr:hypothetical protein [archaeon]